MSEIAQEMIAVCAVGLLVSLLTGLWWFAGAFGLLLVWCTAKGLRGH